MKGTDQLGTLDEFAESPVERFDEFIISTVRRCIPADLLNMEEDVAQLVRFKFWRILEIQEIRHPKAYILYIVRTSLVDLMRQRKAAVTLPMQEDGELLYGRPLIASHQMSQDPAELLVQKEDLADCLTFIVKSVQALPPRQQYAEFCELDTLKEEIEELLGKINPLSDALENSQIDIETTYQSVDRVEAQRLRALRCVAHKKLGPLLSNFLSGS